MRKKKYIQLPKGYLSFSALNLWERNPQRYKEIYFDNRDELRTTNAGMEYGKVVANALEKGVQTGDLLTDAGMLLLPKYDTADVAFEAEFCTKEGKWIRVLAKPDSMDSKTKNFWEYKTGKIPWTQVKAQNHLQMHFYAMCAYFKYDVMPKKVGLVWIETEQGPEGIRPTGHVEQFAVKVGKMSMINTMYRVVKAAKEIEIAFAAHEPNLAIQNF